MPEYMLTVNIKMKSNAMDGIMARSYAKAILASMNISQWEIQDKVFTVVKKLQEIRENEPPRKIEI